jgi:hypothetical protein
LLQEGPFPEWFGEPAVGFEPTTYRLQGGFRLHA